MNGMLGLFIQVLCIIGFGALILWVLTQFPIDATLYRVAKVLIVVFVVVLLFSALFGASYWPWPYRH